jgi:anti-sigma factor RsiW
MHEHGKDSEDCKQMFALLSEYLDAELPAKTCAEIEAHLAGCPPCIEFLESLKRTVRMCHCYEAAEMPGPLSDEVRERLLSAYRKTLSSPDG